MNVTETQFSPVDSHHLHWKGIRPGFSLKLLQCPPDGSWVVLLRVEPGTLIPRHRHTGPVHCFNLSGDRQLETGEVVGPGQYLYEPAGNVDSWTAIGDEPVIVHVVVHGAVERLGPGGEVVERTTAESIAETYRRA